jgi:CRP/FNR family transcriptional regulator
VQRFTFDALSSRLFELMCLLEQAASLRIEQRIAALVLRAARDGGEVRMSQDELARHLGTAREVVSRNMRQLASRGLVRLTPGVVTIRDRAGLQRLSEPQ